MPSNSIAPVSGVVRLVPAVNFKGAVPAVAVPAFSCKIAEGLLTPKPVLSPLVNIPLAPTVALEFHLVR